jgi:WhiB family redox-sensing transcriptional regulator
MDEMDKGRGAGEGDEQPRWVPATDIPLLTSLFDDPDQQEWQERALCAQTDPEAFFPEKGGSTREAKLICQGCEVRAECLEYALVFDERFGIWGGLSERERRRLKRRVV